MNHSRIRGFLLQAPKPAVVRVTTSEGEVQEIKQRSYSKCAETIEALGVDLIECLDADGKVLRAIKTDTPEGRRSDAAAVPDVIAQDPTAAMLTHCANLIHRAYEHSSEMAFNKLVELVDRMNDRSESIERRLERAEGESRRLRDAQVADAFERAEDIAARAAEAGTGDGTDFMAQMAAAFMGGKSQPKPPAVAVKANGANGKGQA